MDLLEQKRFSGSLAQPDGVKCEVSYVFGNRLTSPLPAKVAAQRKELGWHKEPRGGALSATVSLPALGLQEEDVVASLDAATPDGSVRILMQSLTKPELGLTVLVLAAGGKSLIGGDETWQKNDPPIITAHLQQALTPTKPNDPSPTSAARRPVRLGVAPGTAAPQRALLADGQPKRAATPPTGVSPYPRANFYEEVDPRYEGFNDVVGGECCGRSVSFRGDTDAARRVAANNKSGGAARAETPTSLRPDLEAGDGEQSLAMMLAGASRPGSSQEETRKAEAEVAERLVMAAAAGEVGDLLQLSARVGTETVAPSGRYQGMTPLMAASEKGRIEAVTFLLERQAKINVQTVDGWTALCYAIHGQRLDVVEMLLKNKADVNVCAEADDRRTPLMLAALGPRPQFCSTLLAAKARVDARDKEGQKAIHYAAKQGNAAALLALLDAGAKTEDRSLEGLTPLLLAAASGRTESVKVLIARGADVQAQDRQGRAASKLAQIFEHQRTHRILAEAGG
mmetsp:Transcript_20321/g.44339  ORF Transcript_20321/g.44339 Transcript_20321/m.44339 type:complete len:511 (+) Transcript_20321:54-1586(+)